jgi:GNAT superfamily N-acetyltransferase
MQIRLAGPDESPRLTALARAAKQHWGYSDEWMALWREDLTITPEYIETNEVFVATIDGAVIATCALERYESFAHLEHVWVNPAHQRKGIGQALVKHALAAAGDTLVKVLSDPNADDFYRRLGAHWLADMPAPMPGAPDRTLPLLEFGAV